MFFCLKFLIFVLCLIFTTVFGSDDSHKDFLYKGKVINPLCFSLLNEDMIVDLRYCTKQNYIITRSILDDRNGFIGSSYTYEDGDPPNPPYIYYKHIASIEKNLHLVQIEECSGGNATFSSLYLIKLDKDSMELIERIAESIVDVSYIDGIAFISQEEASPLAIFQACMIKYDSSITKDTVLDFDLEDKAFSNLGLFFYTWSLKDGLEIYKIRIDKETAYQDYNYWQQHLSLHGKCLSKVLFSQLKDLEYKDFNKKEMAKLASDVLECIRINER